MLITKNGHFTVSYYYNGIANGSGKGKGKGQVKITKISITTALMSRHGNGNNYVTVNSTIVTSCCVSTSVTLF